MEEIILIGTGPMAQDYAKVLKALGHEFTVVGRGEKSALEFKEKCGIKPQTGGLDSFLSNQKDINKNSKAIIATGTESLMGCLLSLTQAGIVNILIEKPAALSIYELISNEKLLSPFAETIFVAYNRRFYSSVIEAKKLIEEDGGLKSMSFEFTEWAHKIEPLAKAPGVKENWFFANSTHVVDLAFYFAGRPSNWAFYSKGGKISWHTKTNFAGAGITEKDVLFSYLSNWESAGRWGIELCTDKRRIYLRPLEKIFILDKGTTDIYQHEFDDYIDKIFKPGLFLQTKCFLSGSRSEDLLSMSQHIFNSERFYSKFIN